MIKTKEIWIRIFFPLFLGTFTWLHIIILTDEPVMLRGLLHDISQMYIVYELVRLSGKWVIKKHPPLPSAVKHILTHFICAIVISIPITVLYYLLYKYTFTVVRPRLSDFNWLYIANIVLWSTLQIIITLFIQSSYTFVLFWQKANLEKEKLEKDNAISKFNAIKNEINPHFLFNNFNTLYGLINENSDTASKYLLNLSDFYRYLLQSYKKDLVPLEKEIEILEAYTFLLKVRYAENLNISIQIPSQNDFHVPALSLQMLVENAVKHNKIDDENPLTITIRVDGNYIVTTNNIQKKTNFESTGVGLQNIQRRYSYLSEKEIVIKNNNEFFEVKLPLLKIA